MNKKKKYKKIVKKVILPKRINRSSDNIPIINYPSITVCNSIPADR